MSKVLDFDEYTIAWVAVLPIEAEAALGMLDKQHDGYFETVRGDDYIYIGGELNGHKIVVATWPAGQNYGPGAAAALVNQVKARFSNIWFALLVGVAAGLPNHSPEHPAKLRDIRLGDVLVCVPDKGSVGIIQYDLGRDMEEGFFPNGRQVETPAIVRSAIGNIQLTKKKPFRAGNTLANYLAIVQQADEDGRFLCPSQSEDKLFSRLEDTLVAREPRDESERTKVWYGNIGSGSSLMRNPIRRDELRDKYDLIGLEMEAAGIINTLPTGVIRGVCDYGDSEKNKIWQPYAAAVAAAYAKGILCAINPKVKAQTDNTVPFIVPFDRNPNFTGRVDQLAELEGGLFIGEQTSKIAITGLGGVGKTQLVLELAYRTRAKYQSCSVLWIPATDTESLQQAYMDVAQQLNITSWDDKKANIKKLVQLHLSKTTRPWLLIFDNADNIDMWIGQSGSEPGSARLIDCLPRNDQGCVIFTTRDRKVAVKLAHQNIVKVPEMKEDIAIELLRKRLVNPDLVNNRPDTIALLKELTCLPLAIVQAAAYINENGIVFAEYLLLLADQDEGAIDLLSKEFEDDGRYDNVKNPVAMTWLISFEQIRHRDPLAAEYLSFMACIDSKDIPQSLLPAGTSQRKETDAIGTLDAYSFITRRPAVLALDLHRLVHLATRNWLRKEEQTTQWTERAIARLEEVFPDHGHQNRSVWRTYLPHVIYVLISDVVDKDKENRINLAWRFGMCLYSDGRFQEAEAQFTEVMDRRLRVLGHEHPDTLNSMANLASTYEKQGRWKEAEDLEVQVMETRKRVLGQDHPSTLTSIANLASIYRNQGRWKEAEDLEVQVMETRKRVLGQEHPDTLTNIANLASTYRNQGHWKEAEELFVQVMETNLRVLGQEHPSTLTSIANLASIYRNQGHWKEAKELFVQVMETSFRVLGQEHPDTLTNIANLASTYLNQGHWKEAEELFVQVMETRKRVLGHDHPDTLNSMANLASIYRNQGRWKEAEELFVQVMETSLRVLGQEHPSTLTSIANLASTYRNQGRWKEAEDLEVQVMETSFRVLGQDHPSTLTSMANLVSTYRNQGRWDAAEELEVQVMETSKRVLGAEHLETLTSMANLALTYRNQGRWKEAEELEVQVNETSLSVASGDEDIRSMVETESASSPLRVAAAWLIAKCFAKDQELFTLYQLATTKLDETRFIRNNRRLLKSYYLGLKAEGQTTPEGKLVVSFLRLRATRTQISSHIYRILMPEIPDLENRAPSTYELEYSINRFLQSTETNNELLVEEPLRNDEFESNSNSDDEGGDDGDDDGDDDNVDSAAHDVTHAHLQKVAQLLTTGQPFNSYKNSLHNFVYSKFIPSPTQTYTEVLEPQDSRENQDQDGQEIQNVGDQRDDPTTTLVSGNDPADHISWNGSETVFSRSQFAPIKDINKEPHPSEKNFNLMGFLSNLYQSFLLQCLAMAEDIGLYERTLSRGFVRLTWDCICGCCFSQDYPASQLAAAQHFQVQLIQAGYQARIFAWSLEVLDAPVTLHALNDKKTQHIELPKTPSPLQPRQHIGSSTIIDQQSSASGQTAQGPRSEIHPRTEIDHEQTLGKVEEFQTRSITPPSDQWLLLCFYHDKHVSKAVHMEVGEDPYDEELLLSFKKEYITARGWATCYLSWTKVTDIRFVRFLLIREDKNSSFDYDVEDDLDDGRENEEENGAKSNLDDLALLQEEWGPPAEWSERHAWAPCPADPRPQPQGKWIMHLWDKPHSSSVWLASKRLQRFCKSKVKLLWIAFNWKGKIKLLWIDFRLFRGICALASVPNSRDDIELQGVVVEIPPLPSIQVRARQQDAKSLGKGRFFVNNTPKRLEQRLKSDPTIPPYGWGLFFEESLVVPVFFKVSISLVVLLVTIIIVVICAKLAQEKGYQVFGLGGFTLAVASIIVTVIFKFLT